MTFRKTITISVILAGASAMISQIVFMREFLVQFYGNEISVGIILASWLVWGAFGSWFLGRFSDRVRDNVRLLSFCQLALAFVFPVTFFLIRASRAAMGIMTGEIMGYSPMAVSTFLILAAPCALMGFMFSLACRVYNRACNTPAGSIAYVYVFEAVGALAGGLLVSYLLIRFMYPYTIILILTGLNLAASIAVQKYSDSYGAKRFFIYLTAAFLLAGSAFFFFGGGRRVRDASLERLWAGFDVLESRDSVYGNLTVTKRGDQISFYESGLHLYTVPDLLSAETSAHFALLEHASPRKVLLIGGGLGGALKEALKHPVERVDYVELDPVMIEMAREHLSREEAAILDDERVDIINTDGRFFVKNTEEKYDCVIISLGDPYTAQLNRFYTTTFFEELDDILSAGGVVSFGLTSSENYVSDELGDYLGSIHMSAASVFPDILVIPGDTAVFLLSNREGTLTRDTAELMRRMKERGVDTLYVRDYYLFDKMSEERVDYLKGRIASDTGDEVNRDFKPISYYYATIFWGTHFDAPVVRRMLKSIAPWNIWVALAGICALMAGTVLLGGERRAKRSVLLAVMTTGFAEINFQIAVILSFQVIYGYVFYKLGLIITSFMVGLALGGWIMAKRMAGIKDDMRAFIRTQISICVYPLILPAVFVALSASGTPAAAWLGSNVIFPFLPAIAGFIGGIQFTLANKIYLEGKEALGRTAGLSYGLDLFGACLGSLLAAAVLVPVLGIFGTCALIATVNVIVLLLIFSARSPVKRAPL